MFEKKSFRLPYYVAIISLIGVLLSTYSVYEYARLIFAAEFGLQLKPSFCNINELFNCEAVHSSAWGAWQGIPLGSVGLFFYGTIFLFSLVASSEACFSRRAVTDFYLSVSFIGLAISLFFLWIALSELKTVCLVCLALDFVALAFFIVSLSAMNQFGSGLTGLVTGTLQVISAPLSLFNSDDARHLRRLLFTSLFLMFLLSLALPNLLSEYLVKPIESARLLEQQEQASKDSIARWHSSAPISLDLKLDGSPDSDYYKGQLQAPVQIVEFSDFECPACQAYHSVVEEFLDSYKDKLLFVFKNYPLDKSCNSAMPHEMHQNACFAAELARCAGEQGKFWEATNYLFTLPEQLGEQAELDSANMRQEMLKMVTAVTLNSTQIDECLNSKRHNGKLISDVALGNSIPIMGTPSFIINGRLVEKPTPDVLKQIIDRILESPIN